MLSQLRQQVMECRRFALHVVPTVVLVALTVTACTPAGRPAPAKQPGSEPVGAALRVTGLYRYLADAALLTDCASGRSYPVLLEADHLAMEQAYLALRDAPGSELLAVVLAEVVLRSPEPGLPEREHLRILKFEGFRPGADCAAR